MTLRRTLCLPLMISTTLTVQAQDGQAGLARCASLDEPAARLACYDGLAGRPAAVSGALPAAPAQPLATLPPSNAAEPVVATAEGPGLLTTFWELDADHKRGTFRFMTYKPNFLLPVHFTERINQSPSSPTRGAIELPGYKRTEAKMQLSIRTKIAQSVLLPQADVWFGYTQQSMWQLWDKSGSAPFRNTDYEPELIYMVPPPPALQNLPFGWRWRYGQLALAHMSNGQAKPLSRSWNRVYLGAGLEHDDMALIGKAYKRLAESDDDNPDLTSYRGRGELQLSWVPGLATASVLYRSTFRQLRRGALQLDFTYPVDTSEPKGLRWYVQVFSGYGETLTDYNFRQTSAGIGLAMFEF